MQTSTLLLTLAASTSAASIPRQDGSSFNVTSFYFSSIAYTKQAVYDLNVTLTGISTSCSLKQDSEDFSKLCSSTAPFAPAIDGFGPTPCDDAAFSWSLTPFTSGSLAGGYSVQVNYTSSGGEVFTACRGITQNDLACYSQEDEHAQDQEDYIGAHQFTAPASTLNECIYA